MTDSAAGSQRCARVGAPGRGRSASETRWRRHIVGQLKHRDLSQHAKFQDLIRFYTQLLEKNSLTKGILRRPSADRSCSVSCLKKTTGELAYQVLELQKKIRIRDGDLDEQHARLVEGERLLEGALDARQALRGRVEQVQAENGALKAEYDALLEQQRAAETRLRDETLRQGRLEQDIIQLKQQAAQRLNSRNERKSRAREAKQQKELQSAARSKVTLDRCAPSSPETETGAAPPRGHARLFRSASATSPRILSSFRELFEKRRGHSVCGPEEEPLVFPVRVCLSARVPARALQVLEAHEQGINAVRFSSSSDLLATGGTDRLVKLWAVRAGSLSHQASLEGSRGGITCIEFDPAGFRILAASYDNSALLWQLDDSAPKLTLTGHSRKVTAARFSRVHQVATGSADGTVRLWDLQRDAACVQEVRSSYCSDLVCSESCVISGHFDSKIRVWDSRVVSCVQELPAPGKVTSLDVSADHRQLLSCCRDDCLQLVDVRRWSSDRAVFRAEGFKCGSDSTKAVFSPDGCFLAAGSADGAVYIWNVSNGNLETRLPDRHSSPISAVSWSLSGEYVVSVDKSRRAVLWSDI